MALKLHNKAKERLVEELAKILPEISVILGVAVGMDMRSKLASLEAILPNNKIIQANLTKWISDEPLTDFIIGSINLDMMTRAYAGGGDVLLTTIDGWDDPSVAAQRLIDDFDALPNTYVVSVSAPPGLSKYLQPLGGELRIATRVRASVVTPEFIEKHPVSTGDTKLDDQIWDNGILTAGDTYEWKDSYIQLFQSGFLGRFTATNTEHEILTDIKAIWGCLLAARLVEHVRIWSPVPMKRKIIVHHVNDGILTLQNRIELNYPTSDLMRAARFSDFFPAEYAIEDQAKVYAGIIRKLGHAFDEGEESERIRLAATWLFDSYAADNELLSYVQAMVCLEIILGNSAPLEKISLGELLRNRCAYLIGKTAVQRADILKDFGEIYNVRSQIVHRGKSKMTYRERVLYQKLLWYCGRCINEELELIKSSQ